MPINVPEQQYIKNKDLSVSGQVLFEDSVRLH